MGKFEYRAVIVGAAAALVILAETKTALAAVCLVVPILGMGLWLLGGPARWLAAFFCVAVLAPPLPFALGNSGPHPAVAIAVLGLFAGLAYVRDWRLRITPLTAAFLLLTAVIFCSSAYAALYSGPFLALASLARASLFAIAVYIFFFTLSGPAITGGAFPMVRLLFTLAALAALFACFDFYYQFPAPSGFSPQFVWLDSGVFRRAQGLFYEASTLGNFCAFFLVMIGASLVRAPNERPVPLVWMIAGGAVLGAAVVLSYSRASVVNLLVSAAALALVRKKQNQIWRPALILFSSVWGVGIACYLLFPQLFPAYALRLWNSVAYSASSTNGILSGRLDSWAAILRFLMENPWHLILGIGYKTLPYTDFTGAAVIADNNYLSALAETGVIGFAALLLLLFTILQTGYRAAKDADPRRSFFGTWTFCFWCGQAAQMFSGDLLTYWRVLPIYFWVLAIAAE